MSWSTFELKVRFAPWNQFNPSSKIFYWPFQGGTSFVDLLCFFYFLCLLCLCACLFICVFWSPAGKRLTSWLSFVVYNCDFVTFLLVSWVRYQLSISNTFSSGKVFLEKKDISVDLNNEDMLKGWQANIDIQFILDPYTCAMYIVSYIS